MNAQTIVKSSSRVQNSNKLFVAVAGNIGSGKTSLTRMLSQRYGWKAHFESVSDNPYLSDFYADMSRWSFPIQVFFLNSRFKAHKAIGASHGSSIQDRSIYEDAHIFARNLYESGFMERRDYFNYLDLYQEMISHVGAPDLVIYLRKSLPALTKNIQKRGREYESNISHDYLANLNRYYDEWIEGYRLGRVAGIDSDELDFVNRPEDFDKVGRIVFDAIDQTELFLPTL